MTKIDLITGILGSGKTTFIIKYVKYLLSCGKRVAILENDFGAVNVDMMLLQDLEGEKCELEMISGGCDPETHRRRFRTKLIAMGMCGYDRVLVEPSGIYDMDEFFRQHDPQYAAEHPEEHAAKEEIYENLMAGRIFALDEKLAALGQTQEDYLPSEIEKFKDATGYEEFLDFDPAEVKAALEDPNRSRVDEMLAAAEKAEREYAAEAAAYAQTPAAIVEQARAVRDEPVGSFSIYQLKGGNETLDYRFEPLDSIHRNGLSIKPENYELVYEAPLTTKDNLESIYTRFNVDRPADFTGHSLSVSDIVVLHQGGKDTAHYCDRAGFSEVPEFLQPAQKSREITERIQTPRGSFYLCGMTREQMEADGYGFHHASEDGKYLIMANGTQAYAVRADAPEKDNPLRTAEMTLEDDYGMIDGVINNGRRGEELEKAKEHAERTQPEKKPSIRERLAAAKQECAKQQPRPAPEKKPPELGEL